MWMLKGRKKDNSDLGKKTWRLFPPTFSNGAKKKLTFLFHGLVSGAAVLKNCRIEHQTPF